MYSYGNFSAFFLWSPLGNYDKKSCLNKLKFWEASRNQKKSICWKFKLSISLGICQDPPSCGQDDQTLLWPSKNIWTLKDQNGLTLLGVGVGVDETSLFDLALDKGFLLNWFSRSIVDMSGSETVLFIKRLRVSSPTIFRTALKRSWWNMFFALFSSSLLSFWANSLLMA